MHLIFICGKHAFLLQHRHGIDIHRDGLGLGKSPGGANGLQDDLQGLGAIALEENLIAMESRDPADRAGHRAAHGYRGFCFRDRGGGFLRKLLPDLQQFGLILMP